jgi:hypothetical protein
MEGRLVENAFVSIVVSGGVNSPATAQIELVPTDTIKHILPGTWIHVFTTDPWDQNPTGDLADFKLLFEGVVVARGFTRQEAGRSFVIQCADPSIYWSNAKQFWLNLASANGNIVDQLAIQTSGGYGRFGTINSTGQYGYMASKLAFADKDQPEERFLDTMISVLDDIGNVNPFYTNARNRFRLTDRIIRGPAGKAEQLFQLELFGDFIEGLAGRVSGQTNLVEVVNQLLSAILHEWVAVPAPPYVNATIFDRDVFGNIKRNKKTVVRDAGRGRKKTDLYDFETSEEKIIGGLIFKPHVYTISPPSCNVLFPNMYDSMNFSENFLELTTRLAMKPQLPMVSPAISRAVTSGMLIQRPSELEIFTALVRDPKRKTILARTPDGKFADGAGQVPTFTDYDWTTNEERLRGIVYNFMNLAPAPTTLTLAKQGTKTNTGNRKGGITKYLQNIASYEWYKSKFVSRQTSLKGPYNMRPIPGFPLLALDDSASNLNVIANLESISHHIEASGSAFTQYTIGYARLLDEVDLNRPKFKGGLDANGDLDFSLYRDENGQYDFKKLFDGVNQPPIPEWLDESFRNILDLDIKYKKWFGGDAGVVQKILFKNPGIKPSEANVKLANEVFGSFSDGSASFSSVGAALKAYGENAEAFERILEENENIDVAEAVTELNSRYRKARDQGKEFDEAAAFTNRSFTKIDEAFRFIGAGPAELADAIDPKSKDKIARFTRAPAASRVIDYKNMRLDYFVGDTSPGSGYSGKPEGTATPKPTTTSTTTAGKSESSAAAPAGQMSGAFPVFDTTIHTGKEATDAKVRSALIKNPAQRAPSSFARFDGRPLMYDFEFRLWQQSMADAKIQPTGARFDINAKSSQYYIVDSRGAIVRPKGADDLAADAQARQVALKKQAAADAKATKLGRHNPAPRKCPNMPPKVQAPTGEGLEQEMKDPLPQPLSEKQVVDLRRAIIDAYRDELARTRGFTG